MMTIGKISLNSYFSFITFFLIVYNVYYLLCYFNFKDYEIQYFLLKYLSARKNTIKIRCYNNCNKLLIILSLNININRLYDYLNRLPRQI